MTLIEARVDPAELADRLRKVAAALKRLPDDAAQATVETRLLHEEIKSVAVLLRTLGRRS